MKKYVAICATLAALVWVGVAAADTPQGKLTSSAASGPAVTTPIIDGGTSFVGKENDRSGNCLGDSGVVEVNGISHTVLCAHYVAASRDNSGPKMRFTYQDVVLTTTYYPVWRISDGGQIDTVGTNNFTVFDLGTAESIVNQGLQGSGFNPPFGWSFVSGTGYTITASQT